LERERNKKTGEKGREKGEEQNTEDREKRRETERSKRLCTAPDYHFNLSTFSLDSTV